MWLATATLGVNVGANAAADGSFAIAGVPPDDYAVQVSFNAIEEIAATLTIAGDDVSDLRLVAGPGTTVSGRVVFEGGSLPTGAASPVRVVLASVHPLPASGLMPAQRTAPADAEGRFGFTGVSGRVIVDVTSPEGWMMKSVVVDGQDVTHTPLDLGRRATLPDVIITLTNRLTTVSGQVGDTRAQPLHAFVVVLVPAETYETGVMARRVRVVRAGAGEPFVTRGMMPGRYVALALEALEEGRQFSPEFQQQVRRLGQEFSLSQGETRPLTLTLTPDL